MTNTIGADSASIDALDVSDKWKYRFKFFNQYGSPETPGHKEAIKSLGFGDRIKVNMNFIALFFGPIYLLILGLWKHAIVLLGATVVLAIILAALPIPAFVDSGLNVAIALMYGLTANYAYYRKRILGFHDWNPFVGIRWF